MHVKRMKIKDVRGFDEVDVDLTRPDGSLAGWTVLAGPNGSGKSTLLHAVALSVAGQISAGKLEETFSSWIRVGRPEATVETELEANELDGWEGNGRSADVFWTGLRWIAAHNGPEPDLQPHLAGNPSKKAKSAALRGPWANNPVGWFLVGYGPARRLAGHAIDARRLMAGPDRIARLVNLFREDASLVECIEWLREIYLRCLEGKPGARELVDACLALLNDGLLPGDLRVDRIDSDGLRVTQNGTGLPLHDLSEGYRTMAALVMDVVRHLDRCFGGLKLLPVGQPGEHRYYVPYPGVVLIDEIDAHLHVSWQKRIGFWFKQHFPNIQFIVTTHSPFICQAADPRGLIRLPVPGEARKAEHVPDDLFYTIVNGSADDAVLTELFGLERPHSDDSEKLRERVAELEVMLQDDKLREQGLRELEVLRSRLPQSPSAGVEQALRELTKKL